MQTTVDYLNGFKFEVNTRGHRVVCDQPQSNGGADAGMSPPEFLLASLATCAAFYALQYLRTRSLSTDGLRVVVDGEKASDRPARLGSFRIEVTVPALDDRHKGGVMRAVKSCLIHNTLLQPPSIEIAIMAGAETPAIN